MDQKKFETLIDLIINENEEQARELFHEIVVEKSREIYENIMDEEALEENMEEGGMDAGMEGTQVGDILDEINVEEEGMTEEEDDTEVFDLDDEESGSAAGGDMEEIEDAVVRIEDKLDQLMAEFEEIMGGGDEEGEGDEEDFGDEGDDEEDFDAEEEEVVAEAVQLQKVSVTHGDDGAQKKSPGLQNSGQAGMDSKPVKFSGAAESVPTAPKAPSNAYTKGEGDLPGAGKFKNAPGQKGQDLGKTPAPVKRDGAAYTKSPVAKG